MIMETLLTIQKLIEEFYTAGGAVTGLLIYAVIVTIVAVVVAVLLARIAGKMGIDLDKE